MLPRILRIEQLVECQACGGWRAWALAFEPCIYCAARLGARLRFLVRWAA